MLKLLLSLGGVISTESIALKKIFLFTLTMPSELNLLKEMHATIQTQQMLLIRIPSLHRHLIEHFSTLYLIG